MEDAQSAHKEPAAFFCGRTGTGPRGCFFGGRGWPAFRGPRFVFFFGVCVFFLFFPFFFWCGFKRHLVGQLVLASVSCGQICGVLLGGCTDGAHKAIFVGEWWTRMESQFEATLP